MKNEYKTKKEIEEKFTNIIQITNRIGVIPLEFPFEYDGKANRELRKLVINRLRTSYPNLNKMKGVHIAWSKSRYRELFSLEHRRRHPRYLQCSFTLGNPYKEGLQTRLPFIVWSPEYTDVSMCNDVNATYIYQTTKNTWKVFKIKNDS
jgi:hypothetical protein